MQVWKVVISKVKASRSVLAVFSCPFRAPIDLLLYPGLKPWAIICGAFSPEEMWGKVQSKLAGECPFARTFLCVKDSACPSGATFNHQNFRLTKPSRPGRACFGRALFPSREAAENAQISGKGHSTIGINPMVESLLFGSNLVLKLANHRGKLGGVHFVITGVECIARNL